MSSVQPRTLVHGWSVTVLSPSALLGPHVSAKVLLELAEGSSVTVATELFVDAGLGTHLTGSEALTMLAPLDEAFRGESRSR